MNYQIKLTQPDPALDGRHLEELIDLWLEDVAQSTAATTAAGYRQKTDRFVQWWRETGPAVDWQITRRRLAEFGRHLATAPQKRTGRPASYNQQNDVIRRLRQMFRWAYERGYTAIDHGPWLPSPQGEPPKRQAAKLADLRRLLDAAGQSSHPERDRALLAVLIGTGARRAEAASIQIESIQIAADGSGTAEITGKRTKANKDGKRQIAFDRSTGRYIAELLDHDRRSAGPLFSQDDGRAMGNQAVHRAVKRAIERAGLEDRIVGCHDLRRAFATHLARQAAGGDSTLSADLIRRQMGHTFYAMTGRYTLIDVEDIRESMISPLAMMEAAGSVTA